MSFVDGLEHERLDAEVDDPTIRVKFSRLMRVLDLLDPDESNSGDRLLARRELRGMLGIQHTE